MQKVVDITKNGNKVKPIWKKLICAGRAHEVLRADWQQQLKKIQKEIGFEYIRFHGLFNDEMMVYNEDMNGNAWYDWHYVDEVFDFLLGEQLRPIVELGFTPEKMKSGNQNVFWWKGNVTPPADYKKWCRMIDSFIRHCMNRYGKSEVLKWYFEVWNEPNISPFWSGTQEQYFLLYKETVKTIKQIHNGLKVGGPASSASAIGDNAPWVEDFLHYCEENHVCVDFVSTHPYPNEWPLIDNPVHTYRDEQGTYRSLDWLKRTVANSAFKDAEIHITEWNSSPSPRDLVHDTAFMANFIIQNNLYCMELTNSLGFWTFTDVFEENGAASSVFHGGFGLLTQQGLEKPAYHGYYFLSRLGSEVIELGEDFIVTRSEDNIQILAWNYVHYNEAFSAGDGSALTLYDRYSIFQQKEELYFNIKLVNLAGEYKVTTYKFDRDTGSVFDWWVKNGAPENIDLEEKEILQSNMKPQGGIKYIEADGAFSFEHSIKPHGFVFVELTKLI
ncbi:MAG TPA: xylann 1,4-beta-xylosidase [Lachnoclostridium phytofermentans]|uniref:Xylann 1,4-beta-xylosidase n=1 Tax=Lachnoclostridium phytofermentans TaxID=66219 RepID=A0A3D2X4N2_9FIRM|nr:glycosyl hydrolase [Lachnoclostridium sp.]HCL02099.1 xylann 1,4-beta-xylosidase [Lachnoclostridium phytofermentans]